MPEGLSASEVGKEIAEHREHATDDHSRRNRFVSIAEAVLLSLVAIMAAWSGFAAAKWGTDSSLSLAKASSTRTKANQAAIEATLIRTLDAVDFNAAITAYACARCPCSSASRSSGCARAHSPPSKHGGPSNPRRTTDAPADPSRRAAIPAPSAVGRRTALKTLKADA